MQNLGNKLGNIENNTTPDAIATASATGTCRTTQPGGCSRKMIDDAVGNINQNANNNAAQTNNVLERLLNGVSNIANLELLPVINSKLGEQVTGGISGVLGKIKDFNVADRIINILTFLTALNNAFFLSSAVKQTLVQLLQDWIEVVHPT